MNAPLAELAARARTLCLAAFCALAPAAGAQEKPYIDELKAQAIAGDRRATRRVADAYYVGKDGVEQNFAEAAHWYHLLAKQGDVRAQTTLGLMYARGYGVEKNLATAHRWWSFAAAANDPGAQYNLALSYARGEGVAQDYALAAQWYERAARRTHVQAQHNLGLLYFEGKGVAKDPQRAYFWVRVAALQGDDLAQDTLKRIAAGMTAGQIDEAEEQAADWMNRMKKLLK